MSHARFEPPPEDLHRVTVTSPDLLGIRAVLLRAQDQQRLRPSRVRQLGHTFSQERSEVTFVTDDPDWADRFVRTHVDPTVVAMESRSLNPNVPERLCDPTTPESRRAWAEFRSDSDAPPVQPR